MKLLAYCRALPDLTQLSVSRSQGRVFEKGKRLLEPADERAVEAALQARQPGDEVIAIAIGEEADADALRKPLAMGCDRAILVTDPAAETWDDFVRINILGGVARSLGTDKVFAGDLVDAAIKPRTANALAIMKSAKKPIEKIAIASLGLSADDLKPRLVRTASYLAEEA